MTETPNRPFIRPIWEIQQVAVTPRCVDVTCYFRFRMTQLEKMCDLEKEKKLHAYSLLLVKISIEPQNFQSPLLMQVRLSSAHLNFA
jgi:hypothetical protein